jgi:levansucrase
MTSAWTAEHVRSIDLAAVSRMPIIEYAQRSGLSDGRVYWDMWPIQTPAGHIAAIAGRELWMALSAPDRGDPAMRHFEAKIRLIERKDGCWIERGDVLPDFDVDYEREWAGSALFDGEGVSLFFTAAGTDQRPRGYQQRLFESRASISSNGLPGDWTVPVASIAAVTPDYVEASAHDGEAGKIKAFRDPAYFRDPADGQEYLIFTASLASSTSDFNGAIGVARRDGLQWVLEPPLIHADGVNNELERAHVVFHDGRYYAFWVTQSATFSPALRTAPNGLYGMVADSLRGEYRPLNGSGLVIANPDSEPLQTYSWFVSGELMVSSFIDFYGLKGESVPTNAKDANACFGGVPAPLVKLEIAGDHCKLADPAFA